MNPSLQVRILVAADSYTSASSHSTLDQHNNVAESNGADVCEYPYLARNDPRVQIVTITEIVERAKRLDMPMMREVLKSIKAADSLVSLTLDLSEEDW